MRKRSPKHYSQSEYDKQFAEWKRSGWKQLSKGLNAPNSKKLFDQIKSELDYLKSLGADNYELLRKWYELQEFKTKYTEERLQQTYDRIWTPSGYSDYRRLEPELIFVKDTISVKKIDIWGNESERQYPVPDPLAEDWDILRTLVSRHRNAGVIGKQHRYLVRDKGTKKYLGVMCISVDMLEPAGRDALIGWTKDQKLRTQPHCANGSTIVPLSPFAGSYNGGKLLSLLCLSDEVAERWQNDIGRDKKHYRLVHMMTTSLFGNQSKQTMYDNLKPYWVRTPAETSGETPFELSPNLEKTILDWLLLNDPRAYFDHFRAKKKDGSPKMRDPKDKALKKAFSLLGLKPKRLHIGTQGGMYLAPLYSNAYDFLQEKISESELQPAFDNSIKALTQEWKFGLKKGRSGARERLNQLTQRSQIDGSILPTMKDPYWYKDMMEMSWEEP